MGVNLNGVSYGCKAFGGPMAVSGHRPYCQYLIRRRLCHES